MQRSLVVAAVILVGGAAFPAQGRAQSPATTAAAGVDSLARARMYTKWFYTGAVDSVWAHVSPAGQKALGDPSAIKEDMRRLGTWGREVAVLDERFVRTGNRLEYRRTVRTANRPSPMLVSLTTNASGLLVGWQFTEA
jgi:hypothetical protein